MCKVLKISESGYYRWLKNRSKPTSRQLLSVEIQKILDEHPDNDNYGAPRVRIALEQRGITVSERTASRAMSEMGISHQKRVPHGITKATTEVQEQENLIKRDFSADKPLKKVVSDITEIQCYDESCMFLLCRTALTERLSHSPWTTICGRNCASGRSNSCGRGTENGSQG